MSIEEGEVTIETCDGQINTELNPSTSEKRGLDKILDTYIEIYKGDPWNQDLGDNREELINSWKQNAVKIEPLKNNQEIVGLHIYKNGKWNEIKETFFGEVQTVLSYPVGEAVTDMSTFNSEILESEISTIFPLESNIYYLLDMGILEKQRIQTNKLLMLKSIYQQLNDNDYVIGQTLNQGQLFEIVSGLPGLNIIETINTTDPNIKHVIFSMKCYDLINNSILSKLKDKTRFKQIKMSEPINARSL